MGPAISDVFNRVHVFENERSLFLRTPTFMTTNKDHNDNDKSNIDNSNDKNDNDNNNDNNDNNHEKNY